MNNTLSFKVSGRYALFTDPFSKTGGDKTSYPIPTYEALKGIMKSVYWKPTLIWIVQRVRILKPIRMESKGIKPLKMNESYPQNHTLAYYNYLTDVAYQVEVKFIWNLHRGPEYEKDRIEGKHYTIASNMIEKGGRRDVYLGTRECQGYVEPCQFGEGTGAYDNSGTMEFGMMFHGFNYPDETGIDELRTRFWKPQMKNGVIDFIRPDECTISRFIRKMKAVPLNSTNLGKEALRHELD